MKVDASEGVLWGNNTIMERRRHFYYSVLRVNGQSPASGKRRRVYTVGEQMILNEAIGFFFKNKVDESWNSFSLFLDRIEEREMEIERQDVNTQWHKYLSSTDSAEEHES